MRRSAAESSAAAPGAPSRDAWRHGLPARVIRGRNRTKADILVYRDGARQIAVKEYARRPWWIRWTVGRLLVRRECAAYRLLDGVAGLAPFVGRLGPWTLATEFVPGTPLAERPGTASSPSVFDRLDALLARIHARGVALSDLHHRDVLVGRRGEVWVVDLATAVGVGRRRWPLRRRLVAALQAADRDAARRLRRRYTGDGPRAEEAPSGARRLKRAWDRLRRRRG